MRLSPQALRLLDSFALRAKRSFYGMRQGAHRSQRRGHGVEFAEYRQYEIGDNPRSIDWNLYSRSDKLYIKRYLEEENVAVYIVIDGSRSLTHSALRIKWDLAASIASAASYVALATQDPVMISVLGGPVSPRYWGGKAFGPLNQFLDQVSEIVVGDDSVELDLPRESRSAAARVKFPGICVFISDFLYPLEIVSEVLAPFRARNMEIHAVQLLTRAELELEGEKSGAVLIDSETGVTQGIEISQATSRRYSDLIMRHNAQVREHCLGARVSYTQAILEQGETVEDRAIKTVGDMGLFV